MVTLETGLRLVGGVFLLVASGYFVTTEFAMTRVRQFDESEFTGSAGLERAWAMTDRLEIYLSGCQLGITVSSVGLGVVAERLLGLVGVSIDRSGSTSRSSGPANGSRPTHTPGSRWSGGHWRTSAGWCTSPVLQKLDALENGETALSDVAADPVTLPAGAAVSDAVDRFQAAGAELALVTAGAPEDDVEEVVGLVTATDLLEVISGGMEDPLDEQTPAAGTR